MAAAFNLREGTFSSPSILNYMSFIQVAVCQTTMTEQQHSDALGEKKDLLTYSQTERGI